MVGLAGGHIIEVKKDYKTLLAVDQLLGTQKEKKAWYKWSEGDIDFQPTFKVEREPATNYCPIIFSVSNSNCLNINNPLRFN